MISSTDGDNFHWTVGKIALSIFLFVAAALCEIGGGWLIWQAVRKRRSPALLTAAGGCLVLVGYGFLPTAQPPPNFGRLYAVYGGIFVAAAFAWGHFVDGEKIDAGELCTRASSTQHRIFCWLQPAAFYIGDWIGSIVAVAGVAVAWFWPR